MKTFLYCECGGKMHPLDCSEDEFQEILRRVHLTPEQWESDTHYCAVNKSCPNIARELQYQDIVGSVGNVYILKWKKKE